MKKEASLLFNLTFHFNSKFGGYVDHIYTIDLEIKDTTDTIRSASYLDLYLGIDSEDRLRTKLRQMRGFQFPIINFPFICSTYIWNTMYISQLIRYSRASGFSHDFLDS